MINYPAAIIALLALAAGAAAFGVLLSQLLAAQKPSELQLLAARHVEDWLRETGEETPPLSSVENPASDPRAA
jgi:hypothetical protein